jgi:ribose-phosphate pyrophosphokinase
VAVKLFSLNASMKFAERVAHRLDVGLSAHEEREFGDREFKVRSLDSVRGERLFVFQSLYSDPHQSVNDKLCRLLFFVGALKDAAAAEVIAVVPYLAYARKDRRTKSRDPVTTRYLASMFEAVGVDAVITADVHNLAAYENAFRCGKENLEAAPLFVEHFKATIDSGDRIVVLSPDAGGVKRARAFMALLEAESECSIELAFMEKQRSGGRVTGEAFAGDVQDATVIVIDDLISGGTTMARAARACKERGARAVHAAATHGVFGHGAGDALGTPEIESVVITDTVGDVRARCPELGSKLVVLDSSELFSSAIRRISSGA